MTRQTSFKHVVSAVAAFSLLIAAALVVSGQPSASMGAPSVDSGVDSTSGNPPQYGTWYTRTSNGGNPVIGFHLDG
jgi:hypothetical protein